MHIILNVESARVKGLSFHSKRPWLLVSLHNGHIILYDYAHGVQLEVFKDHSGPVRGIDFHKSKPLFVSGGDDHRIKVWDFVKKSRLFELLGHSDYVRTVQFHEMHPWVLSASDDQTVRIWNWQSRACVTVLTGHNHYVMRAQFHPAEDLVLSASLDETIRVWDISALTSRKKKSDKNFLDGTKDLFSNNGVYLKFSMEGHIRGVNWAEFHPRQPLIVSAADDREVKIWRYNSSSFWETETIREHSENVSCAIFDPNCAKIVLSNSEDRLLAVWDESFGGVTQRHRLENHRFWILAAHPANGLFAAGHDGGFLVFRTRPEFPPLTKRDDCVVFSAENSLTKYDLTTKSISELNCGPNVVGVPRKIAMIENASGQAVYVLCYMSNYRIVQPDGTFVTENCLDICPVTRTRFVVLDKTVSAKNKGAHKRYRLIVKNAENKSKKVTFLDAENAGKLFEAKGTRVVIALQTKMLLFDVMNGETLFEYSFESALGHVQNVVWSKEGEICALLFRHRIVFLDPELRSLGKTVEENVVDDGIWDEETGTLIYTCGLEINYSLVNGEKGTISVIQTRLKLLAVTENKTLLAILPNAELKNVAFNRSEFEFKRAIEINDSALASDLIDSHRFMGQKIVSFLVRKNLAGAALRFGQNESVRFELALECGDVPFAFECAKTLDSEEAWNKLGEKSFSFGYFENAENAYRKAKNFSSLAYLYFLSGQSDKLRELMKELTEKGDQTAALQACLYFGDAKATSSVLKESGFSALAFTLSNSNSLFVKDETFCQRMRQHLEPNILKRCECYHEMKGLELSKPKSAKLENWPNSRNQVEPENKEMERILKSFSRKKGRKQKKVFSAPEKEAEDKQTKDFEEWMQGLDTLIEEEKGNNGRIDFAPENSQSLESLLSSKTPLPRGRSAEELWLGGSPTLMDYIAAGEFETAYQMLFKRFRISNKNSLKDVFSQIRSSSFLRLETLYFSDHLNIPLQVRINHTLKPMRLFSLGKCEYSIQKALEKVTARKFEEALTDFRLVAKTLPLLTPQNEAELESTKSASRLCREYVLALLCNKERTLISESNLQRAMELACYWTLLDLKPIHTFLGLLIAINIGKKLGYARDVITLCNRCLDIGGKLELSDSMHRAMDSVKFVLKQAEHWGLDEGSIGIDLMNKVQLDSAALKVMRNTKESRRIRCLVCGAQYSLDYRKKDDVCSVCLLGSLGHYVYTKNA